MPPTGMPPSHEQSEPAPAPIDPAAPTIAENVANASPTEDLPYKPKLEVHVPSVGKLASGALRSRSGVFIRDLAGILMEMADRSSEGLDREALTGVADRVKHWPDTELSGWVFAADTQGGVRWAVRVHWPLSDLHSRVRSLLRAGPGQEMFHDVTLVPRTGGGFEVTLPENTVAYLLPTGEEWSLIASHDDLIVPKDPFFPAAVEGATESPLLACRLNLSATEKDSGATFFSSFNVVTAIEYSTRVDADGDWVESAMVLWPPLSGMGAKAIFGKVKQTYFVPDEAFGALAMSTVMGPPMLEGLCGFGPQVMMDEKEGFAVVGEAAPGPIAGSANEEMCLTILPGTGFLPVPDFVVQTKARRVERFVEEVRSASKKINQLYREREQRPPWHEATVRDRVVFWRESGGFPGGFFVPGLQPVMFTTKETDAKGKDRDVLVLAWTSTSPENLVRRWVDFPRGKDRRCHPSGGKTDGQLWLHWRQLYRWVHPYVDVALSAASVDALLPSAEAVKSSLSDATVSANLKYAGLTVAHRGPIPLGALAVPAMLGVALAEDDGGGSDLARERLASRRLRVLYHHCKHFHKDLGRWPAEIAELDGYVDFDGHPELLKLELSSKKQWSEWFKALSELDDDEKKGEANQDEEEEDESDLEDRLYVIDWRRDRWRLGLAPGTLEHLDELYVDQDGKIHRVEAKKPTQEGSGPASPSGESTRDKQTSLTKE